MKQCEVSQIVVGMAFMAQCHRINFLEIISELIEPNKRDESQSDTHPLPQEWGNIFYSIRICHDSPVCSDRHSVINAHSVVGKELCPKTIFSF